MIDQLIQAYRAKVYDWEVADVIAFLKENFKVILVIFSPMMFILGFIICSIIFEWGFGVYIAAIVEAIYIYVADQYLVKRYQVKVKAREGHLEKVQELLWTFTAKKDLYTEHDIKKIIDRLSQKIESQDPIKSLFGNFGEFVKTIILPVITFFAGVSSTWLEKMELKEIINIAVTIIVGLGVGYFAWTWITKFFVIIVKKDYNAAKSLREDLEDILLFFLEGKTE